MKPKPKIHYAQHMSDMIKEFGPAFVFACWAGERLNHILTQIQTNLNPGE